MAEPGTIESCAMTGTTSMQTETERERFFRLMDRRYRRILQWAANKGKDEVADSLAFLLLLVIEQRKSAKITGEVKDDLLRQLVSDSKRRNLANKAAADALHNKPGGSREKQQLIRNAWASGKYTSRDRCAEEECGALNMSFSAARKALRNTPEPPSIS